MNDPSGGGWRGLTEGVTHPPPPPRWEEALEGSSTAGGRAVPGENPSPSASCLSFLICIMGPSSDSERYDREGSQIKAAGT